MSIYRNWANRLPRSNNPQSPYFIDDDERDEEQELRDMLDDEKQNLEPEETE